MSLVQGARSTSCSDLEGRCIYQAVDIYIMPPSIGSPYGDAFRRFDCHEKGQFSGELSSRAAWTTSTPSSLLDMMANKRPEDA